MADAPKSATTEAVGTSASDTNAGNDHGISNTSAGENKVETGGDTKPTDSAKEPQADASEVAKTSSHEDKTKEMEKPAASPSAVAETAPVAAQESAANTSANPNTPSTAKKTNGNGSAKKKSTGVPEHKSRKLNKKKSKPELKTNLECQPGDMFLARMKGHAPWPSIVCDEEILPESLLKSRPVTAALADGSFKKPDYAPGGKRQAERTFPIMFLYTNEFAWLPNTDLTPVTPEECKGVEDKAKSKSLIAAFGVAAEGHDLQYFKTMLADHQAAIQEDLDAQAEKEAEKAAAKAAKAEKTESKKARRKSAAAQQDEEEDDMEVDGEEGAEKPKSKKRKKAADAEDATQEKPTKTAKLKLNGPKTPSSEKKSTPKPKSSGKKAAKKDSDVEMEEAPASEAKPLSAAEIREKKDKEIRYYRHKLQRGLLSKDEVPSDEEVANASNYLGKLETYPNLEGEIIRSTKIHKVLRAMIRLPNIPKDEEYQMKKRCSELLQKWHHILGSDGGNDGGAENAHDSEVKGNEETTKPSAPTTSEPTKSEEKPSTTEPDTKVNGTSETLADRVKSDTDETNKAEPEKSAVDEKPVETAEKHEEANSKPVEASA